MAKLIPLEHPGVILKEEFIEPLGLSSYMVSKSTKISQTALGEIIKGKRRISTINGIRLSRYFGVSDDYFVKLQMQYDLDLVRENKKDSLGKIIKFTPKKGQGGFVALEA